MVRAKTPEPVDVCDQIERLARVYGILDAVKDFCPPYVSRQIGNASAILSGSIADIGKLLEDDEG